MRSFLVIICLLSTIICQGADINELQAKYCPDSVEQNGARLRTFPLLFDSAPEGEYFVQNKMREGRRVNILFGPLFETEIKNARAVVDFKVLEDSIYVLTIDTLIELDKDGYPIARYNIPQAYQSKVKGLAYHAEQQALFLAQGRLGLRKFDLNSKSFTSTYPINTTNDNGHYSSAISVVAFEDDLYVLMTGASQKGFNGVVIFDPASNTIKNKAAYDRRRSGVVGVDAKIYTYDNQVVINNSGWIHRVSMQDAQSRSTIRPRWQAIAFVQGNYQQYIMLSGDLIFSQDKVLGCGRVRNLDDKYFGQAVETEVN